MGGVLKNNRHIYINVAGGVRRGLVTSHRRRSGLVNFIIHTNFYRNVRDESERRRRRSGSGPWDPQARQRGEGTHRRACRPTTNMKFGVRARTLEIAGGAPSLVVLRPDCSACMRAIAHVAGRRGQWHEERLPRRSSRSWYPRSFSR